MISNDNFFDISILHQVPEIGQSHQFSFNSQCQTLNRTSTGHSTHQRETPLNLAKCFTQRFAVRHPNEQQTLFINPTEIPPAWSSTYKCSRYCHSGLSPSSLWVCKNKTKKFMYAMLVEVILPINTINHQTILSINTLTEE